MPVTSANNMQTVKPTGGCVFFKPFGRLMHRIGHPPHHALRFRTNLWMAWRDYRSGTALFRGEFTQDTVAELVKFLLAHTGLPRVYRKIDRWRRRHHKPHLNDLDTLTQEAVRLFFSHLDTTSLPSMSRAILYGSRARGDYRDDSDVDIMLVFAGAEPDYDTQVQVCNAMAGAQAQTNAALPPGVEVTSFCHWADESDEPDVRFNPDFYRNVLADGLEISIDLQPWRFDKIQIKSTGVNEPG